ncbi:hypothetical protein R84B8_01810 [Treponema sp. R8-4-B8]
MTDRQEMQWLYAKSLELAILLKGAPAGIPPEVISIKDYIKENYDPIAETIMYKIIYHEQESKHRDQSEDILPGIPKADRKSLLQSLFPERNS